MNGGTLSLETRAPFTNPIALPIVSPINTARAGGYPPFIKPAVTQELKAIIDPTDKSIPPVRITKVIPAAIIALKDDCLIIFIMFENAENRGERNERKMTSANITNIKE
jgi:hypothetical protein